VEWSSNKLATKSFWAYQDNNVATVEALNERRSTQNIIYEFNSISHSHPKKTFSENETVKDKMV
jgi:hypothetical protein